MEIKEYAPAIARYGVGIVFFTFGIMQLTNAQSWLGYLPSFVLNSGFNATTFVHFNGALDLVIGILLLTGLWVRIGAGLGILHLLGIIPSVGFNDVAVRDFGLLIVLISVFVNGKDKLCLGRKK